MKQIALQCSLNAIITSDILCWAILVAGTDAEVPGAGSRGRLYFVGWHLVLVGPQYGTCFISFFRRPELWSGS